MPPDSPANSPADGAAQGGPSGAGGHRERALAERLSDAAGTTVAVEALAPLHGGACQENFLLDVTFASGELAGRRRLVLRSDAVRSLPGSLRRRQEFAVIQHATRLGVRTPLARWLLPDLLRPGADAYVMDWAPGEAIGAKVVRDPALTGARVALPQALAETLAALHRREDAAPSPALAAALGSPPSASTLVEDALAAQRASVAALPEAHPALDLALRWLEAHPPVDREVTLVHGDFRTGNFLVTPGGLSAVLDWEFAHWGSPLEDVAWLCVRDWRFGRLDLAAGGFCRRAAFYEAYARASGREVRPADVHFWEVLGNVRWAIGAVVQGLRYLESGEADLELIAIARRAAEMEFEALRLIERGA